MYMVEKSGWHSPKEYQPSSQFDYFTPLFVLGDWLGPPRDVAG